MFQFSNNKLVKKYSNLLAAAIFMFLSLLFFAKGFLGGKIIWGPDTPKVIYPFVFALDEALKNRQLPLWTPEIFFGFPIGAEGQFGLFYPPNLLHLFLPLNQAVLILSLLHFFMAGFFTYLFARLIKLGYLASIFAGVAFMFNGFIIAHLQYPHHIYAYAYLPLVFLLVELALNKGKGLFFAFAGLILALQFLTGHPNIAAMTFIATFLYSLIGFWRRKIFLVKGLLIFIITFILVSLPYLVQLMPLISLSIRAGGTDFTGATTSSFSFYDFITFLFPNFFFKSTSGTWSFASTWHFWGYWGQIETTGYIGAVTLLATFLAIFITKHQRKSAFLLILTAGFLLALGKNTPLYGLLFHLPLFNGLRAPGRFLYLIDFCLIILAAMGISRLDEFKRFGKLKSLLLILSLPTVIVLFVAAGGYLTNNYPQFIYYLVKNHYSNLGFVAFIDNPKVFMSLVAESFAKQTILGLIFLAVSTFIFILAVFLKKNLTVIKASMILLLLVDLFVFADKVNLWIDQTNLTTTSNDQIKNLKQELSDHQGRVYTFSNFWSDLMPNQLLPYGIPEANGFASLPLKRFSDWQKIAEDKWQNGNPSLLETGSIKYVYQQTNGIASLISLDHPLPHGYLTDTWQTAPTKEQALNLLSANNYSPQQTIIETGIDLENPKSSTENIIPAQILEYKPDYVKIITTSQLDKLLVLTDTNYPGWQAFIDGKRSEIYQANYLFRAVFVPAGNHQIIFQFQPPFLNLSILISLATTLFVIFWSSKNFFSKTSRPVSTKELPKN